jgi:hypothetical protein
MRMNILSLFSVIFLFIPCLKAQQEIDSVALRYSGFINREDMKRHLEILASDEYEGRETGKAGQKKAAAYISEQFKSYGIKPLFHDDSYYQVYYLLERKPQGNITLSGNAYRFLNDFYYYPGFSDLTLQANEVVFLGYGIEDKNYNDYKDKDVKGKIIVVLDKEPYDKKGKSLVTGTKGASKWTSESRLKASHAREKGALAMIVLKKDYLASLERSRHYIEQPSLMLEIDTADADVRRERKRLPVFYFNESMAEALVGKDYLQNAISGITKNKKSIGGIIKTSIQINIDRDNTRLSSENVLAYIEGTDLKKELIIITAHYDHIGVEDGKVFNGADDDGSGTVAIMEIAEAFQKAALNGHRPRRSVLIMPVSGEEKGLLGSYYYSQYPVFPLENTVANLNIDMIGRLDDRHKDDPNYVYVIGSDILSMDLHNISESANDRYSKLQLDYTYNNLKDPNRFYYRSDHYNFARKNVPVIFYFNGVHEDYHKHTDDVEKIDFVKMEKITRLVFFTAWDLANRNERPRLNGKGVTDK